VSNWDVCADCQVKPGNDERKKPRGNPAGLCFEVREEDEEDNPSLAGLAATYSSKP
jgi:hypothetical protein